MLQSLFYIYIYIYIMYQTVNIAICLCVYDEFELTELELSFLFFSLFHVATALGVVFRFGRPRFCASTGHSAE